MSHNDKFGEELSLREIFKLQGHITGERATFGKELTLQECLDILNVTKHDGVPERAKFFSNRMEQILEMLVDQPSSIEIEGREFRVEYHAKISPMNRFQYVPMGWVKLGVNGSDPQSRNKDQGEQ
jgi:hypothetical protein